MLLQPGQAPAPVTSDQPIHLHMPASQETPHRAIHRVHHVSPKPPAVANVPPASDTNTVAPFDFGGGTVAPAYVPLQPGPLASPGKQPPAHVSTAHQSGLQPAKTDMADHSHLAKHGAVIFDKGASDPSPAQFTGVKVLAGDLGSALQAGTTRVELQAYGGAPGDKSSDARRLSLKRALAVRQLLIDDGLPSDRIDVRAMGGIDDKGPADRVDVFIRAS
jgi:outer membrane protein OmpA-like peptidoglycan-associated protein